MMRPLCHWGYRYFGSFAACDCVCAHPVCTCACVRVCAVLYCADMCLCVSVNLCPSTYLCLCRSCSGSRNFSTILTTRAQHKPMPMWHSRIRRCVFWQWLLPFTAALAFRSNERIRKAKRVVLHSFVFRSESASAALAISDITLRGSHFVLR